MVFYDWKETEMPEEIPHVCLVPADGRVCFAVSTGERGSDPCLGRPWRDVATEIRVRFKLRDSRTTFEVIQP